MNLHQAVREDFSKAAGEYDRHADLQRDLLNSLVVKAMPLLPKGSFVLDAGCGTGQLAHMKTGYWIFVQMDIAPGMCAIARRSGAPVINSTLLSLPFASNSFDGYFCSSVLQWVNNKLATFTESFRCLKPGGNAFIAVFGEHTLHQLKTSFKGVDGFDHVITFPTKQSLVEQAVQAGFVVMEAKTHKYEEYYGTVRELMYNLKALGARNKRGDRKKTFTSLGQLLRLDEAYRGQFAQGSLIPATWQVHYLTLRKP